MKKICQLVLASTILVCFGVKNCFGQVAQKKVEATFLTRDKLPTTPPKINKEKASPDLETIRTRIIKDLLEPVINEKTVDELITSIKPDGSWPNINYKDVSRTGFEHSKHLENMFELSRAFKKQGSRFYANSQVKKVVSSALDFWLANDFISDNWWWNEMGTPNWMINTLLVLDNDLTEKQQTEGARIAGRANLQASGARPGGDLIQIAGMFGKQALFARNEDTLQKVVNVMADQIKVTTGRGLKPDLSFHHRVDNVISTLAYGTGYANAFAYWAVKIAGTKYKLPEASMKLLIDYYLDGICKSLVHATYPDPGAENRGVSRKGALDPIGPSLPQNLLQASNYRKAELEEIVKIRRGEIKPALRGERFFWHSEYFTHQRPNYFASVRMHSSRGNNMEQPHNEEGLKNHHYGDGSNFISSTGKEYYHIFPVWDWQKIPGTTVVQKPEFPHWKDLAKKGLSDFVGGVTDGEYGAAAFDFTSVHDPLKARKSWFFFDKEYVSLGAGINSTAEFPVATTLNQCLLKEDVVVKSNNKRITLKEGEHHLPQVSCVLHDGVAYIFPKATPVHLKNSTAAGTWRSINHQAWATEEEVRKDVFKLWLDHGARPQNAKYEYIVVPGIGAAEIDRYNKNASVVILANSPEIQAVKHKELNRTQIVFYKAGELKISNEITVKAENACMIMIKANGNSIAKLVVSDPSRKLKSLGFHITAPINSTGDNWKATWNKDKKSTAIHVDLPADGDAGKSVILETGKKI